MFIGCSKICQDYDGIVHGICHFLRWDKMFKVFDPGTNLVGAPKSYLMGTHYIQNIRHTTKSRWDRTCGGLTQKIYLAHWVQQRQKQWPLEADEIGLVGAWPGTFTWDTGAAREKTLTLQGFFAKFPEDSHDFMVCSSDFVRFLDCLTFSVKKIWNFPLVPIGVHVMF